MPNAESNLQHFKQWFTDKISAIEASNAMIGKECKLSDKDKLILSQSYCRNFPNRLPLILAELLNDRQAV